MTGEEFGRIVTYLELAIGKPIADGPKLALQRTALYHQELDDVPADVLWIAARRVVQEHRFAIFPSIAELRAAAAETARGLVTELSAAEAWKIAWRAAGRIDPDIDGSVARGLASVPQIVVEAMEAYGIRQLCYGSKNEPLTVVRAQFTKIFEQLQARERKLAMLPPAVQDAIGRIGRERQPAVTQALAMIGAMK